MKVAVFFVLFLAYVSAQQTLIVIDDFVNGANEQSIAITLPSDVSAGDQPVVDTASRNFPGCSGLIGCGRDMEMRINSGPAGRRFTSDIFSTSAGAVFPGEWTVSNPKSSTSIATLQYDGTDGTFALDEGGLGGIDITVGGSAREVQLSIVTDLDITYTIEFIDVDGGICFLDFDIDAFPANYDYDDTFFSFELDDFSNGCDLDNVGAIEIFLPSDDAVDAIVRQIAIVGVVVQPSDTPTPGPSPSRTPQPEEECMCHCPIFTCALIFDPDDDENNAYYFDDDDEREVIGSNGSINYYDFESSSDGVLVQASVLLVAVLAALVL